jgi:uncharacterized phage infection (PIP) family protein YhgE
MPQAWQREQMGLAGLEQDILKVYEFLTLEVAQLKGWVLKQLSEIRKEMADFRQAAQDAQDALDGLVNKVQDLSAQLKTAVENNDTAGVQAVADELESHAQAAKAALNPVPPADTAAPVENPPVDVPENPPTGGTVASPPVDASADDVPAATDPTQPAGTDAAPTDPSSVGDAPAGT